MTEPELSIGILGALSSVLSSAQRFSPLIAPLLATPRNTSDATPRAAASYSPLDALQRARANSAFTTGGSPSPLLASSGSPPSPMHLPRATLLDSAAAACTGCEQARVLAAAARAVLLEARALAASVEVERRAFLHVQMEAARTTARRIEELCLRERNARDHDESVVRSADVWGGEPSSWASLPALHHVAVRAWAAEHERAERLAEELAREQRKRAEGAVRLRLLRTWA